MAITVWSAALMTQVNYLIQLVDFVPVAGSIYYVIWLAVETMIIWFLYPETKDPTLEELGRLFEDEKVANSKFDSEKAYNDSSVHIGEKSE
jgi:hypothetical protein